MSIFNNIFGQNAAPEAAPAAAPNAAPNATPAAAPVDNAAPAPSNSVPAAPNADGTPAAAPATADTPSSDPLLDEFASMWQPNTDSNGNPITNEAGAPVTLDEGRLTDAVNKASFTGTLTPETLQAVLAGGDGAVQALTDALNTTAQQASLKSIVVAQKLIQHAMESQNSSLEGTITDRIKQLTVRDNLNAANPVLSNPAVAPVVAMVEQQFRTKFPEASPAEITQKAQSYVVALGGALNPAATPTPDAGAAGEPSWDEFMKG